MSSPHSLAQYLPAPLPETWLKCNQIWWHLKKVCMYQEGSCKLKCKLNYFTSKIYTRKHFYKLCLQCIPHLGVVPRKQRHEPVLRWDKNRVEDFSTTKNCMQKCYLFFSAWPVCERTPHIVCKQRGVAQAFRFPQQAELARKQTKMCMVP